jgi:hypothetical protein
MDNARRGFALIINNKDFLPSLELDSRQGTDKDASTLEYTFMNLGFDVKTLHNLTADNMRNILERYAEFDHSDADCFCCILLSHGDEGLIYGTDDVCELDKLIEPFKFSRSLAGKPKLFFIQACRGTNLMDGIDSDPFSVEYVQKVPVEGDFLFAYSTISGHYSWRNSVNGSWFIQSLCKVLNEQGNDLDIMRILTAVNRRVAYFYESNSRDQAMTGKKQVPCIVSMLTKELYFRKKKVLPKSNSIQMSIH